MLKGFISLPWWLRKKSEPKVYDVCCPQCGWRKTIELGKACEDSHCIHGEEPAMEIWGVFLRFFWVGNHK